MRHLLLPVLLVCYALSAQAADPGKSKSWRTVERENREHVVSSLTDVQTIQCADRGCFNSVTETVISGDYEAELLKLDRLAKSAAGARSIDAHSPSAADYVVDHLVRIAQRTPTTAYTVLHDDRRGNRASVSRFSVEALREVQIVDTLLRVAEPGKLAYLPGFPNTATLFTQLSPTRKNPGGRNKKTRLKGGFDKFLTHHKSHHSYGMIIIRLVRCEETVFMKLCW